MPECSHPEQYQDLHSSHNSVATLDTGPRAIVRDLESSVRCSSIIGSGVLEQENVGDTFAHCSLLHPLSLI